MPQRWWGLFVSLTLLAAPAAWAQVRQVSGQVTNAETGQGVGEATVAVTGTSIEKGATTPAA